MEYEERVEMLWAQVRLKEKQQRAYEAGEVRASKPAKEQLVQRTARHGTGATGKLSPSA